MGTSRLGLMAAIAMLAATIAGCADDSSSSNPTPTPTPTATAVPPTATSTAVPTDTVAPTATPTSPPTSTPTAVATATSTSTSTPVVRAPLRIAVPGAGVLVLASQVPIALELDPDESSTITATIDGEISVPIERRGTTGLGSATVTAGVHTLAVHVDYGDSSDHATVQFEAIDLEDPDQCEILNNASCLLPYPSSRFLEPADTATGYRIHFPAAHMPKQNNRAFPIEPFLRLDGFSPTVPITMHFARNVDPALSGAARLLDETRTHDLSSLDPNSPTVLIDATTGERVLHFVETEVRAAREGKPARETLLMHPAQSLIPAHRYLVAMRRLVDHAGEPITAEPAFAAFRDNRLTSIPAIEGRRDQMEALFSDLVSHGVAREDLVLAFDFVVASDESLTSEMLLMRDETFAWLAQNEGVQTFTVTRNDERSCAPGTRIWRRIEGTFKVPLYISKDPLLDIRTPAFFNRDENDRPFANGFTNPPFTIVLPCSLREAGGPPVHPIVLGHGLFGDGNDLVEGLVETPEIDEFNYIAGATDWLGLSRLDAGADGNLPASFVGRVALDQPRAFAALPDRTRQGQLNTLVLARMMKNGAFNLDPAFQRADGSGVMPGPEVEEFYFGASLGGIMGLMFAALSPDVERVHADVPGISFALLLPRSTAFLPFDAAIQLTGVTDPIQRGLLLNLTHELWVRGESAGYATHITENPLPGSTVKQVLLTAALYDQLVSNLATELAARTLKIPSINGSILPNRPGLPDVDGPVPSGVIYYDAAAFDPNDPRQQAFIPPLADLPGAINRCDPHGDQAYIPAAIDQLFEFLRPGGQVQNFCNGLCDAAESYERPHGNDGPCDPFR